MRNVRDVRDFVFLNAVFNTFPLPLKGVFAMFGGCIIRILHRASSRYLIAFATCDKCFCHLWQMVLPSVAKGESVCSSACHHAPLFERLQDVSGADKEHARSGQRACKNTW